MATLAAGWDNNIGGVTLNRFCASGLEAINLAAMKVRSGPEQLVVGSVELSQCHVFPWVVMGEQ